VIADRSASDSIALVGRFAPVAVPAEDAGLVSCDEAEGRVQRRAGGGRIQENRRAAASVERREQRREQRATDALAPRARRDGHRTDVGDGAVIVRRDVARELAGAARQQPNGVRGRRRVGRLRLHDDAEPIGKERVDGLEIVVRDVVDLEHRAAPARRHGAGAATARATAAR